MYRSPRARGKYAPSSSRPITDTRSPPRTREIPTQRRLGRPARPLTPAHAGNTLIRQMRPQHDAAHPRARGKYFALAHFSPPQPRSPPRTREIQPSIPLQIPKIPFTPACAGNTLLRFRNVRYRTAYPYGAGNTGSSTAMTGAATEYLHAGGQHQNPDFLPGYISRLPPRTREIRKHAAVVVGQHPLTPAHAGNTRKQRHRSHRMPAHPRARGKYAAGRALALAHVPLTPAHAGNTASSHC